MDDLYDYQNEAVKKMKNGCILCGGVGSGKSRTAIAYYFLRNGGRMENRTYTPMDHPKDLYIITTARKRDTKEWEQELAWILLSPTDQTKYSNTVVVDSWNNLKKYVKITDAMFIFDEQRLVGNGVWVKSFLKIAKTNEWILLSATPGDTWLDYLPVFLANGFYKNRTEFRDEHVIYDPYSKFPKVKGYVRTGLLLKHRNEILVPMAYQTEAKLHHETVYTEYDPMAYKTIMKRRWDPWKKQPIQNASELCYLLRKIVNSNPSRLEAVLKIATEKQKVIIFYSFDYELELLKACPYVPGTKIAEWNGHLHELIPKSDRWVYLVQYTAGSEGWNCVQTDTMIFYSQNYSYKVMKQSAGRIDRLNTPFKDLYYYHLKSRASIDLAIGVALQHKKTFNESSFQSHQLQSPL